MLTQLTLEGRHRLNYQESKYPPPDTYFIKRNKAYLQDFLSPNPRKVNLANATKEFKDRFKLFDMNQSDL